MKCKNLSFIIHSSKLKGNKKSQLESFRQEVKDWLEENGTPSMKTPRPVDEVIGDGRNAVHKNRESKL